MKNELQNNRCHWASTKPRDASMQTTLSRIISTGIALALFAASTGARADEKPVPVLRVDMPHGGCRLTIQKDGGASISYGAMPRWVRVPSGTFDFDQLVVLLRAKSYPQGDGFPRNASAGTLSLPEYQDLSLINDAALVRSLLERGWKARAAPTRQSEDNDYLWVARACSFS